MILQKNNEVIHGETRNGKVIATVQVNGRWVSNPSVETLFKDGWEEYTPPQPKPYVPTYDEVYKAKIVELVRAKYDVDDEFAILRQRESKSDQFEEYNEYVEDCKAPAREYAEEMTQNTNQ